VRDIKTPGMPLHDTIDLTEEYEVLYWTKRFGVTKEQLAAAVEEVGRASARVEQYLRNKK
jgi:hypothetical protein